VIREGWEYGAFAAARRLELPLVTVGAAPYLPPAALPGAFGDGFDRLRRELGVAPDPSHRDVYGRLFLDAVPPGIQLPGPRHAGHRYLRPVLARRSEPAPELPPGRAPLVYVTFGTVWSGAPGLYETVLSGLGALAAASVRIRVLVSSGVRDPRSLGPQPPNVRIERRVAQHAILPRCDLVIHHGGYNTTVESLACGVPALIIPISADQFFFAARCQAAGVARTLARDTLAPDQLAAAVAELLADPSYGRRAAAMARRMARLMSPRDAARRILDLAGPG
jgi:UDP:flavonoid glycosyltransferase YjiC (YdhE family)